MAANSGRKTNWCQRSYDAKGELAANPRAQSGIGRFTFTKKLPAKLAATLISQFCAKLLVINNVASKSKVGGQSDSQIRATPGLYFALSGSRTPAMGECPRAEVVDEQVPANRQHKARLPRLRAEDVGVEQAQVA